MPHIAISMYPGRDKATKERLARVVRDALAAEMQADYKYFSVSIEDVAPENWQQEVDDKVKEETLFILSNF